MGPREAEQLQYHGQRDNESAREALAIWYAVLALATIAVVIARFAPWFALSFIVIIRISAVLPLSADRRGLPGDIS
jgi:hypothetical protein